MAMFVSSLSFVLNGSFKFMPKPVGAVVPQLFFEPYGINYWSSPGFFDIKDVFYPTGAIGYSNNAATGTASKLEFFMDSNPGAGTFAGSWSLDLGTGTVDAATLHASVMTGQGAANLFMAMLAGDDDATLSPFRDVFYGFDGDDVIRGGDGNDRLNGGKGDDELLGEAGNDSLTGGSGIDQLEGGVGRDNLAGGKGSDLLAGGLGQDTLAGQEGRDVFVFRDVADSGPGAKARDTIIDFEVAAGTGAQFVDRIDLTAIDAKARPIGVQSFTFIGDAEFTAEGQVRAIQSGADTWIELNTKGQTGADMVIVLAGFLASDFTVHDLLI